MTVLTKEQRKALHRVWQRTEGAVSYLEFRRKAQTGRDYVMVEFCGMWLGIEHDGYTHS